MRILSLYAAKVRAVRLMLEELSARDRADTYFAHTHGFLDEELEYTRCIAANSILHVEIPPTPSSSEVTAAQELALAAGSPWFSVRSFTLAQMSGRTAVVGSTSGMVGGIPQPPFDSDTLEQLLRQWLGLEQVQSDGPMGNMMRSPLHDAALSSINDAPFDIDPRL